MPSPTLAAQDKKRRRLPLKGSRQALHGLPLFNSTQPVPSPLTPAGGTAAKVAKGESPRLDSEGDQPPAARVQAAVLQANADRRQAAAAPSFAAAAARLPPQASPPPLILPPPPTVGPAVQLSVPATAPFKPLRVQDEFASSVIRPVSRFHRPGARRGIATEVPLTVRQPPKTQAVAGVRQGRAGPLPEAGPLAGTRKAGPPVAAGPQVRGNGRETIDVLAVSGSKAPAAAQGTIDFLPMGGNKAPSRVQPGKASKKTPAVCTDGRGKLGQGRSRKKKAAPRRAGQASQTKRSASPESGEAAPKRRELDDGGDDSVEVSIPVIPPTSPAADHVSEEASNVDLENALERAAAWIDRADAMIVGSGAGMGVDAGLSTFRGRCAGWTIPALEQRGLQYEDICDPKWFQDEPHLAWSFWEFCHKTYQEARPHEGYELVQQWASRMQFGAFSYTSNVDSHWLRSGWDESRLVEVHGAIRLMQCSVPCGPAAWDTPDELGLVEKDTGYPTAGTLPLCPRCGAVARPDVMMFGQDGAFSKAHRTQQEDGYERWLNALAERAHKEYLNIVCLELGCGVAVSTVRRELECVMTRFPSARLIRVNPEQPQVGIDLEDRGVGLPLGALDALQELERRLQARAIRRSPVLRWSSKRRGIIRRAMEAEDWTGILEDPAESGEESVADSAPVFEPRRSLRIADRVMREKRATKQPKQEEGDDQHAEEVLALAPAPGSRRRRSSA